MLLTFLCWYYYYKSTCQKTLCSKYLNQSLLTTLCMGWLFGKLTFRQVDFLEVGHFSWYLMLHIFASVNKPFINFMKNSPILYFCVFKEWPKCKNFLFFGPSFLGCPRCWTKLSILNLKLFFGRVQPRKSFHAADMLQTLWPAAKIIKLFIPFVVTK